jgi:CTP synthase (UTP-ammonia lyase)
VEITLYKEHTVVETEALYHAASTSELKRMRHRWAINQNYSDQINLVGFKCDGQANDFLEAYISWE